MSIFNFNPSGNSKNKNININEEHKTEVNIPKQSAIWGFIGGVVSSLVANVIWHYFI
ncbi:MAG: hypothetical protein MJZ20_09650 [Bacteroidaceae bacterium]|nr:hypothetical protein [Bacteroidaceae bacterium]